MEGPPTDHNLTDLAEQQPELKLIVHTRRRLRAAKTSRP